MGLVTATGVAGVTTDDPSTGAPGDATSTPIIGRTKLSIRKIGPKTAIVGQVVTYTLRVKNTGSQPATAVVVTDRLPAGLSVFRRPAGATVRGRVVTWKISRIAPGRTVVLTVRVLIARTATGTKTDVATAKAGNTPAVRATLGTRLFRIAPGGGPPVPTG